MSSNPPDGSSNRFEVGTENIGGTSRPSGSYRPGGWSGNGRGNGGRQGSYHAENSSGNDNFSGQDRFGRRFENSGDNNGFLEPSRTGTWHGSEGRNSGPPEPNRRGGFSGYGRGNGGLQGSCRGVGNRGGNGYFSGQNRSGNGFSNTGNSNGFSGPNRSGNWSNNRGGNGYMARYGGGPFGSIRNGTWNQNGGAGGGPSGPNRIGTQAASYNGNQAPPAQKDDTEYKEARRREMKQRKAAYEAAQEAKREASRQKNAERHKANSQWPAIRTNFEPKVWIDCYNKLHEKVFTDSIDRLRQLENLTKEEAEKKLSGLLVKATFVELHLTVNGEQTSEQLFETMKLAITEPDKLPFESVEDLDVFIKSVTPLFFRTKANKQWRNTGTQIRRFCQYFYSCLQLGHELKEENCDEDYKCFKETIDGKPGKRQTFADIEVIIDLGGYQFLAEQLPAFIYNDKDDLLYLNPDVPTPPLTLVLPIFAEILHGNNPVKLDKSRKINMLATFHSVQHPHRGLGYGMGTEINGQIKTHTFLPKFPKNNTSLYKTSQIVTGYVRPNSQYEHIEVFEIEPVRLDYSNNRVAHSFPIPNDKPVYLHFESLNANLRKGENKKIRMKEDAEKPKTKAKGVVATETETEPNEEIDPTPHSYAEPENLNKI